MNRVVGILTVMVLLFGLVACTKAAGESPGDYSPTIEEYDAAMQSLPKPVRTYSGLSPRIGFSNGVSLYAAEACVSGLELTPEGFRAYIIVNGRLLGKEAELLKEINQIDSRAREVIGKMLALTAAGARLDCLEKYVHPRTVPDTKLSAVLATMIQANPPRNQSPGPEALHWLVERQGSLLAVLTAADNIAIPSQVPIPRNSQGLNAKQWRIELTIWENNKGGQ